MIKILHVTFLVLIALPIYSQTQTARFELEQKQTDDYFTVLPNGQNGAVILRDLSRQFGQRTDGDEWELIGLDTTLTEEWRVEFSIEHKFVFKAYELYNDHLYLLFRKGDFPKQGYHLMDFDLTTSEFETFEIENELDFDLSHISFIDEVMILGGYVRLSPTLVTYKLGEDHFDVVPGFFKDRSNIVGVNSNENGTFNVLTLEKDRGAYFLAFRLYAKDGTIVIDKKLEVEDDYRILSGEAAGFFNGNMAIVGTYGSRNSNYAKGIYFAIMRPQGQKNEVSFVDFPDISHFFDYMRPKRAERLKRKFKRKEARGKELKYTARMIINKGVVINDNEFLLSAEVYDPQYQNSNFGNVYPYNYYNTNFFPSSRYMSQPSRLANVESADHFDFLTGIYLRFNANGKMQWNQSLPIDDVESFELEPVTDFYNKGDEVFGVYRNEQNVIMKSMLSDTTMTKEEPIFLFDEADEIYFTYEMYGGTEHWFKNSFLIWGYHKILNKNEEDKRRSVLYINKVKF